MTDTTTKTRTPRSLDAITKGALSLPLADRVALVRELKQSIQTEVAAAKTAADQAQEAAADL
jgi:hypothetical protein